MNLTPDQQYLNLCRKILNKGTWILNKRTGKGVLTLINADLEYDCSLHDLPVLTTKKTAYKSAMAEMLGYLRGYNNAADFRRLGTKTWDANANAKSWQDSPYCDGSDHMGYCYGEVGRKFRLPWEFDNDIPDYETYDQLKTIYNDLKDGIDNRREIMTFLTPGTEYLACLPACMHTHTFSIIGDTLHLTSYQRSADMPLGVPFNMIQVAWLLMTMARITGLQPGTAYHKMVNVHIYEDQIDGIMAQIKREPMVHPKLIIGEDIRSLEDLMDESTTLDSFEVLDYESHEAIKFPFSV